MNIAGKWAQISELLLFAHNALPTGIRESDFGYSKEDFLQYLSVNELRLAMEELDGVMEDNPNPGPLFWKHMIEAANLMNKFEHAKKYEQFKVAK